MGEAFVNDLYWGIDGHTNAWHILLQESIGKKIISKVSEFLCVSLLFFSLSHSSQWQVGIQTQGCKETWHPFTSRLLRQDIQHRGRTGAKVTLHWQRTAGRNGRKKRALIPWISTPCTLEDCLENHQTIRKCFYFLVTQPKLVNEMLKNTAHQEESEKLELSTRQLSFSCDQNQSSLVPCSDAQLSNPPLKSLDSYHRL